MHCKTITLLLAVLAFANVAAQNGSHKAVTTRQAAQAQAACHPWQGKRVGFIGDSMTDPKNNQADIPRKYWHYLQQMLAIEPYVYGKSGRQWDDVPRQAGLLASEHGDSVDAVIVFIGTNDFNAGVPIGRWYDELEDTVTAAVHGEKKTYTRKRRAYSVDTSTLKGRINIAIMKLKTLFPDKQTVLLTPIHRAAATFGETNIQPVTERHQPHGDGAATFLPRQEYRPATSQRQRAAAPGTDTCTPAVSPAGVLTTYAKRLTVRHIAKGRLSASKRRPFSVRLTAF